MIRKLTVIALTTFLAVGLSAGAARAGHHEVEKPPNKEHQNHDEHEGHGRAGHKSHGDHHDSGKEPKVDDAKK